MRLKLHIYRKALSIAAHTFSPSSGSLMDQFLIEGRGMLTGLNKTVVEDTSFQGRLLPRSKYVYLLILSVQQILVDLAGQVTPQTLVLQAGPGYLYHLLVLAYLDLGYQGSPFLLLFQEIL